MPFNKNLRGARTYAWPADDKYRDNYDKIFSKKPELVPCEHEWHMFIDREGWYCYKCRVEKKDTSQPVTE